MAGPTYTNKDTAYSLERIRGALEVHAKTPVAFTCINTRIILRTGVNLKKFTPAQNNDAGAIAKVREALRGMGVVLEDAR